MEYLFLHEGERAQESCSHRVVENSSAKENLYSDRNSHFSNDQCHRRNRGKFIWADKWLSERDEFHGIGLQKSVFDGDLGKILYGHPQESRTDNELNQMRCAPVLILSIISITCLYYLDPLNGITTYIHAINKSPFMFFHNWCFSSSNFFKFNHAFESLNIVTLECGVRKRIVWKKIWVGRCWPITTGVKSKSKRIKASKLTCELSEAVLRNPQPRTETSKFGE